MFLPTFSGFVFMAFIALGVVHQLISAPFFVARGLKAHRSHTELVNTLHTLGVPRVPAELNWSLADSNPQDTPGMATAKEVARKEFACFRQLNRQRWMVMGACFAGCALMMLLDALGVTTLVTQR